MHMTIEPSSVSMHHFLICADECKPGVALIIQTWTLCQEWLCSNLTFLIPVAEVLIFHKPQLNITVREKRFGTEDLLKLKAFFIVNWLCRGDKKHSTYACLILNYFTYD